MFEGPCKQCEAVARADREAAPYFGTETNASDVAVRYLSALLLPKSMQARERPPRGRPASAHPVRGQAQLTIDGQVRTLQAGRRAARTAAAFCPDTKVVLILCEPASRAHRHYSFRAFGKGIFAAQKAKYANQTFDLLVERQLQELPPEVVELRRALLSSPDDEEAIARAELRKLLGLHHRALVASGAHPAAMSVSSSYDSARADDGRKAEVTGDVMGYQPEHSFLQAQQKRIRIVMDTLWFEIVIIVLVLVRVLVLVSPAPSCRGWRPCRRSRHRSGLRR